MRSFKFFTLLHTYCLLLCVCGISFTSLAQNIPQVIDVFPRFNNSGNPSDLTAIGNKVIFNASGSGIGKEPHLSDGTVAGTAVLMDIFSGANSSNARYFTELSIGGVTYAYYVAEDGTNSGALYRTNVANGTTEFVVNVNPTGSASSTPGAGNGEFLVNVNGTLFFSGQDPLGRQELFKSDGTAGGTALVKDINTAVIGGFTLPSNPENLTNINGRLFFTADASFDGGISAVNRELWTSDGTAAGTFMVKDIHASGSANPSNLIEKDGMCYFLADDGTGVSLWKSDGTTAGTTKLTFPAGTTVNASAGMVNSNNILFFSAQNANEGAELWISAGGVVGRLKDLYPGSSSSNPTGFVDVDGICYFSAVSGNMGAELWRSNGTVGGTSLVKDIQPGSFGSSPQNLTAVKSVVNGVTKPVVYFTAFTGAKGRELWKSDGTDAGTVLVKDVNPSSSTNASKITGITAVSVNAAEDGVFFAAYDGDINIGTELWYTTTTGCSVVAPLVTNQSRCGAGTVSLTASGATTGQVYKWYLDATSTAYLKLSTDENDNTYTTPILSVNRDFYVSVAQADGSCESDRVKISAIVSPLPVLTVAGSPTVCAGQVATYSTTMDGGASGIYNWTVTNGTILTGAGTASVTVLWSTAGTGMVNVAGTNASGCTGVVNHHVNIYLLAAPAVANSLRCGTGSVVLTATKADGTSPVVGETFRWYDAANGGNLLEINTGSFTVNNLSATTSYYVSFDNGSCESNRVKATATVITALDKPLASNLNVCGIGQLGLTASSDAPIAVEYRWYDAATGGSLLHQSATPEYVVVVTGSTTYYVSTYSASCGLESERTSLTVTYSPLTGGVIGQDQQVQNGGTPAMIVSNTEAGGGFGYIAYQWEYSENGIDWQLIAGAFDKDYQSGALYKTTYFRRLASSAECGETESNVVKVEIVPPLNVPTFDGQLAAIDTVWAVQLHWVNNDSRTTGFYLEKGDGTNFTPLDTLGATDTSYIDRGSILGDKAYYRLRAFSGTLVSAYAEIRIAPDTKDPLNGAQAQTAENTLVYPNPVGAVTNIKLDMPENGTGEMILRSNEGRAVLNRSFTKTSGTEEFALQMQQIKPGIYWLEIMIGDKRVVKRIIKN